MLSQQRNGSVERMTFEQTTQNIMINPNISQLGERNAIQNASDNPNNANGIGKNAKSTFENAVETFKKNTAQNMSDIRETHYRAISEGTKGLSAGEAIWQKIKNIAHNIKAFMTSPTSSATEIGKEAKNLVNSLNTEAFRKDLMELCNQNTDEATKMLAELTKEFGDIAVLKKEGNHNGECGKTLDCAMDFLSVAVKVIKECVEDTEIARQDWEAYDANPKLKKFLEGSRNILEKADTELQEALRQDPKATLKGTEQLLDAAKLAVEMYNTNQTVNRELLLDFENNSVVNEIRSGNDLMAKNITDIIGKFGR